MFSITTFGDTIFSTFKRELKKIYIDYDKIANESDPKRKDLLQKRKDAKAKRENDIIDRYRNS